MQGHDPRPRPVVKQTFTQRCGRRNRRVIHRVDDQVGQVARSSVSRRLADGRAAASLTSSAIRRASDSMYQRVLVVGR